MQLQQRNLTCPIGQCPQGYQELVGHDEVYIDPGSEIEILAGTTEILKEEVPEGKHWKMNVSVSIVVT